MGIRTIIIKTILILLMALSIKAYTQPTNAVTDTIPMKLTTTGVDEIFGTQNSTDRQVTVSEISGQEFQEAKNNTTVLKTYPGYNEEMKALTDSFCAQNGIKGAYSFQTHHLFSESELIKKGMSYHVTIEFPSFESEEGTLVDSSRFLILLRASNNVIRQIQVDFDLYGFYFGEYFKGKNLFEINLSGEFGPLGELLFHTGEGYLYKTNGELIYLTGDSLLLFATNFRDYTPGPRYPDNKIEFFDLTNIEPELYSFDLTPVIGRLNKQNSQTKTEQNANWVITEFTVVKTIEEETYYLWHNHYEVYVQLSRVIYTGNRVYSIQENKYFKTNPRDSVYPKK
ncbi:hypothetical protein DSECCO2_525280 [anaerobic digester metagenome]